MFTECFLRARLRARPQAVQHGALQCGCNFISSALQLWGEGRGGRSKMEYRKFHSRSCSKLLVKSPSDVNTQRETSGNV